MGILCIMAKPADTILGDRAEAKNKKQVTLKCLAPALPAAT